VPLFRLLLALTVFLVIADQILTHLPSWAISAFGLLWLAVLAAAGFEAWRESRRDRSARIERERYGLHSRS